MLCDVVVARLRRHWDGEVGVFFSAGADEKAEALPVEGDAVDVPERGHEDRDTGVVVCEPDRVRKGLAREGTVFTRVADEDRLGG